LDGLPIEETFYKGFGKVEKPFGDANDAKNVRYCFEYVTKSRSFKLRNLPYSILAEKFRDYKNNNMISEAIESCRMKSHIKQSL